MPTYTDYINTIANLLDYAATITSPGTSAPSSDPNFNNYIQTSILTAENRIQRDLDLLNTYVTNETGALTANSRLFTLPTNTGTFVVTTQVYPIISGVRSPPLTPISYEAINAFYPSDASLLPAPSIPLYWCPFNQTSIYVVPSPDFAYGVGVVGTQRLTPLSSGFPSNFLTVNFWDLYIAAAMVSWSGFERNYGSQADDPKMAVSWEATYQGLLKGCNVEEARKRFSTAGWSARQPVPATPPQM